jgi:hypothetical protein
VDWGIFKRHPKATAIGATVVIVLVLVLKKMGGGSTASSGGTGTNQYDAQIAQLSAATSAQQAQIQGQVQAAQITADVQKAAIAAQQEIADKQSTNQALQYTDELAAVTNTNATKLHITDTLAGVQTHAIDAQAQSQQDVLAYLKKLAENQYTLSTTALSHVKDVNGSQNRVSIIESAMGNIPGSVAAEQGQTASSISGDNMLSSITNTIGKVFAGLFG